MRAWLIGKSAGLRSARLSISGETQVSRETSSSTRLWSRFDSCRAHGVRAREAEHLPCKEKRAGSSPAGTSMG